nr:immunoglobulin heavy chain junction region [Macaca mulatta]MOV53825.1 immunoglobulin heavy chain junction region [Macaca mulatta]MOV55034.1 immunoglobulin heavy chain junction region [Macaca mulatta]MOV55472.1 immunoglobulin heavy chain junction region [Macaca mulatta]MOV55504.1 immunoglobulin heavy chain junction region [Macaca mulatta]
CAAGGYEDDYGHYHTDSLDVW